MAPHELVFTENFVASFADLDLVADGRAIDRAEMRQSLRSAFKHLQAGELEKLSLRQDPRHANRQWCALLGGIWLVFEIFPQPLGSGKALRYLVHLLGFVTAEVTGTP